MERRCFVHLFLSWSIFLHLHVEEVWLFERKVLKRFEIHGWIGMTYVEKFIHRSWDQRHFRCCLGNILEGRGTTDYRCERVSIKMVRVGTGWMVVQCECDAKKLSHISAMRYEFWFLFLHRICISHFFAFFAFILHFPQLSGSLTVKQRPKRWKKCKDAISMMRCNGSWQKLQMGMRCKKKFLHYHPWGTGQYFQSIEGFTT